MNLPADDAPLPRLAIACLALAAFGSGASLRINDALLPRLATEFAVPLAVAAQVISVFAVAYGAAQLLFGPLGDRFGTYRVVGWGCAACAASAAACAAAPDFTVLRLARVIAGISAASVIPLAMAWIGDVVPYERRQPVLARFLIGQILGLSAGVWLGGFAADHLSWRTPYAVVAALFAVVGVAVSLLERRLPARARATRRDPGSAAARMAADFADVLSTRWARVILGCVFLEGVLLYGPFAFIATHLHQRFGVSLAAAGSLVMLFGFGGFAFALASQRLVGALGEVGLSRAGGVVMSGSLATIGLAPAWSWAVPACFGAGLGFYMFHNTLQVNATQMTPARRGPAVSAFAACFFLGQSAGVSAGALLAQRWGTGPMIALGAGGLLVLALVFARLRATRPSLSG
ncbi:MAG TPA: MFS transporter [Burkholderiaceae bacterium]